ncbi:MAG: flavin reductase family protein [Halocynthiibacter sp.]
MFYEPQNGHGLPHNPFNALITPRPIGWISTRSAEGIDNLAPYSFFNGVAYSPPQVMFATTSRKDDQKIGKDSLANIIATKEFCVNIVAADDIDRMNATSDTFPKHISEFDAANIERAPCERINVARVANAPVNLECKLSQVVQIEGADNHVVFGEVIAVHMRDDCIVNGRFDISTFTPLARLGYRDYTSVEHIFSVTRPDD